MKPKICCYSLVALSLCASTTGLWAQDRTLDGRTSTQSTSRQGFTPEPSTQFREGAATTEEKKLKKWKQPVVLSFDSLPGSEWELWACGDPGSGNTVANGILTVDSFSCDEYLLWHPNDVWHQYVDNAHGWMIEARLKVDPITAPVIDPDRGAVQIWANDHTNLLIIGFRTNELSLAYPDVVRFPMDTTNDFHTYRIESKLNQVRIFVDGILRIDHPLTWSGDGSDVLMFGDGVGGTRSLSYWDYFSYDVFP